MERNQLIKILAIESSCDETAASIIEVVSHKSQVKNLKVLSNIVSSQVKLHAKYGGVYPELASREHVRNVLPVVEEALSNKRTKEHKNKFLSTSVSQFFSSIDAIAVTTGPGLIGSLLPGVNTAKTLSYVFNKPIYSINHLEGHIYANFVGENLKFKIKNLKLPEFPILALVVSGGHTSLIYMEDHLKYKIIGETLDDAAGEAFDKVAKLLNLGYPGGPEIAKIAEKAISNNHFASNKAIKNNTLVLNSSKRSERLLLDTFRFPRPMINSNDFDFSFSGLKTAVLYAIKKLPKPLTLNTKKLICREFQDAVVDTLIAKTILAAKKYKVKSILLCGGVAANFQVRKNLKSKVKNQKLKVNVFIPSKELCTDNAAMIGVAAAYKIALGIKPTPWYNVNADANLKI